MKGRQPLPFQLIDNKKRRLTAKQIQARKDGQPSITSAKLECPKYLCAAAKKEWARVVALYGEMPGEIINDLDANALAIYCDAVVTYQKAIKEVRKSTEVYVDSAGPKKNPWLAVANEAAAIIKKYGEALLLDPVSRARIGVAKSKEVKQDDSGAMFG